MLAPLLARVTAAHLSFAHDPSARPAPVSLIVAEAGYGKTDLLESQRPDGGLVVTANDLIIDGLPDAISWIGVDDLDEVSALDQARLLRMLLDRPDLDIAISSRSPLDATLGRGHRRRLTEHHAPDLALTPYAVAGVLAEQFGISDPDAALRVADLTAGWPALVRLAGESLGHDPHVDLGAAMSTPGAPAADWLRAAVLDTLTSGVRDLLAATAWIDPGCPLTQPVCDAVLAELGHDIVPGLVELLRRSGLVVRRRRVGDLSETVLVPIAALVLRGDTRPPASDLLVTIARTYELERAWLAAAQAYAAAGDHRQDAIRLVEERGDDMLRRGDARRYVDLVDRLFGNGSTDQSGRLRRTYADALRMTGDPSRARRAFAPLVAEADADGWQPGLAARVAQLHYLCGEFPDALGALDRCTEVAGSNGSAQQPEEADDVDWLACRAHVLVMIGRPQDAQADATRGLQIAERLGDARALGVAHLALARASRGALMDLHYDQAVHYATEADDAVTATRALQAQTSVLLAVARYDQARVSAGEAARMARLACPPGLQAAALHNLGEALTRTGAFDEALWHFQCSVALCRRLGPARAALGLVGIADIHRALGHQQQARAAYTEAAELARRSEDVQVRVAALCGEALLAADEPTPEAQDAAAEALRLASDDVRPHALSTAGRLARALGDRPAAAGHARRAVTAARAERASDLLAEALELEATVHDDPARIRDALHEALSIWVAGGALPDAARIEVLIGLLPDADGTERSRARGAARELRRLGLKVPVRIGEVGSCVAGTISVTVLGPFSVTVEGTEVALPAWRSRQARTLVKILAAHGGRVVTRDRLCDLLWPDDDPARTGHRLSVLLATVRGVLDPTKAWPPDRYIAADQCGVRLVLGVVVLDAEMLLCDAAHAAELLERGDGAQAREVLAHVDALYRGEAFEDESDEWASGLREEVRAAWGRSMRRLANLQLREGRGPEALGVFARLLSVDPYDEQVHRRLVTSLVRAGRHGEARRAFERWRQAMKELDAPPPDAAVLDPGPTPARDRPVLTPR